MASGISESSLICVGVVNRIVAGLDVRQSLDIACVTVNQVNNPALKSGRVFCCGGPHMCRCPERGEAIIRAAEGVMRGDIRAVQQEAAFIVRTAREDAAALAQKAKVAAVSRLAIWAGR